MTLASSGVIPSWLGKMARDERALVCSWSLLIRAPRALASDGLRWHARAYCFLHREYRDFVLTRMASISTGRRSNASRSAGDLPLDGAWTNFVELDLVPAPTLGIAQAAAIRREYGFEKDTLTVRVREALVFYAIRRWGLDRRDSRLSILEQRKVSQGK
jgi:hypothetical protein